ncbi:MAG TPA: response regulator [Candidatus Acidoferrales bacterium]|nr:response regulator [Candidatus Acidoferrales bacterium]
MAADHAVVFVVDDDPSIREALQDLIQSLDLDTRVFASPQEFLRAERPDAPACLVLDVRLPGVSGLSFQQELVKGGADLPVIFITGHGDVPMSVRAMKAGAIEFLSKPFRDEELIDAINVGIERSRAQRREAARGAELRRRFAALTQREREVMTLVISGRPNKRTAAELGVSEATVKVHRAQIMHKMQAKSLVDLVHMGDALGLSTGKSQAT